ncbi:fused DNA polymerase I 5'-_3' exonuclease; 3'-_5' polymerase; 3'-_5' exonuclease [Burkholderiales bacterium]|nr:fused DNA polymerase I 5'->3' exonuclease; 3'->5' polymerase; 3'->5' exonuclease [Burkholderiales bacterium]
MKTLLLVDGTGYLYRAFHAMPDLRTSGGEPTGAVRGFIAMLRTLRAAVPCDYCACVFDAKGKTFRDELFPEYKAHRPPMPSELAAQIPTVHEATGALGWPILQISGVEADDVIGTLAAQARAQGLRTVIASGDKDLTQLVDDSVQLIDTMSRDGGPPRRLDRAQVVEKFGVAPGQIVDYLALVGDPVDNVPGVEQVGPKTATKWLQQYGSLDEVIAHAATIGGVVGEKLRQALGWLPTARALVTVRTDVDLAPQVESLEQLQVRAPDRERLRELFARCEFRGWQRDFDATFPAANPDGGAASPVPQPPAAPPGAAAPDRPAGGEAASAMSYECVLTQEQLTTWLGRIESAELTSIDTETTSLDPMAAQLVGISLAVRAGEACYIPLGHRYPGAPVQLERSAVLERLRSWLESDAHPKLGQHSKYDAHVFANAGLRLAGIAHDTLLQSYVIEAHRTHDLESLAARHLGRPTISYEEVCGKGAKQIGFDQVAVERATEYAAEDAEVTLAVHAVLWPKLAGEPGSRYVYESIEIPVSRVLFSMERTGVLVDPVLLRNQSRELGVRIVELEREAFELAGQTFNLGSPKQVGEILFGRLGLPVRKKTATGTPSTDEEVLEKLAADYPLPKTLLEHRALSKLRSTYCDKLPAMINPQTGRVHTTYGQAIAVTGRLASSDPNLQNIPARTVEGRRIREAFVAPAGSRIVSADYSQIELRIMAHICGDPGLIAAFERGDDVHRATAAEVFGVEPDRVNDDQRRTAKVINFGLIYGMSSFGLAANLGISKDSAKLYIDRYFARYPGVARYMESTRASARELGYVQTVFGRRLWLPEIKGANGPRRQAAERAAINAPMQGTAADLIKLAMIAADRWLARERLATRLVMQVHDELVFEVPQGEVDAVRGALPAIMTGVVQWRVPLELDVGVGGNWDEAH